MDMNGGYRRNNIKNVWYPRYPGTNHLRMIPNVIDVLTPLTVSKLFALIYRQISGSLTFYRALPFHPSSPPLSLFLLVQDTHRSFSPLRICPTPPFRMLIFSCCIQSDGRTLRQKSTFDADMASLLRLSF